MNDAFTRQVQDFTRQAQEMFTAGKDAKVPENISAFAEDAIAKSRDAYHKFTTLAKDNAKVARSEEGDSGPAEASSPACAERGAAQLLAAWHSAVVPASCAVRPRRSRHPAIQAALREMWIAASLRCWRSRQSTLCR